MHGTIDHTGDGILTVVKAAGVSVAADLAPRGRLGSFTEGRDAGGIYRVSALRGSPPSVNMAAIAHSHVSARRTGKTKRRDISVSLDFQSRVQRRRGVAAGRQRLRPWFVREAAVTLGWPHARFGHDRTATAIPDAIPGRANQSRQKQRRSA